MLPLHSKACRCCSHHCDLLGSQDGIDAMHNWTDALQTLLRWWSLPRIEQCDSRTGQGTESGMFSWIFIGRCRLWLVTITDHHLVCSRTTCSLNSIGYEEISTTLTEASKHASKFNSHQVMMLYAYGVKKVYGIKGGFKGKSMRLQPLPLHIFKSCWDTTPWSKWSGVVNPQCWITLTPENVQDIHLQGIYWDALIPLQIATWRSTTETGSVSMREISRNNKWVGGLAWRAWYSRFIWSSKPSRACYDSRIAVFVCPYETTVCTWWAWCGLPSFLHEFVWIGWRTCIEGGSILVSDRGNPPHLEMVRVSQQDLFLGAWDWMLRRVHFMLKWYVVKWRSISRCQFELGLNASQGALYVEMVRSQMT